jgi:D-sedoheptulose 7-phosphate isomerase
VSFIVHLNQAKSEIERLWNTDTLINDEKFGRLVSRVTETLERGGTIAFAGNGGSAAEASHLAAEFTGKCLIDHEPWRAISLNDSSPSLTAIGNDFGFENVFLRPSKAYLKEGDLLISLSTSGKSANIEKLLQDAAHRGIYGVLWTGKTYDESTNLTQAKEIWKVNSTITSRIQEVHLLWGHLLAELVEVSYG